MNIIFLKFLDIEYDGLEGHFLDVMEVHCELHGLLASYPYSYTVMWDELGELVDTHLKLMHF